jgi:hypothetical protein
MGFLNLFSKSGATIHRLPSGSITVDRHGNVVTKTISSSCPEDIIRSITGEILKLFRQAREKQLPMSELSLHFASLQITARELRGGAIIFLSPKTTDH